MPIQIRYLGQSGFEIATAAGRRVVIDPFLRGSPDHGIPPSPVRLEELDKTELVLVSHGAWDHLGEALDIAKRSGALVCCDAGVRVHALKRGIPEPQVAAFISGASLEKEGLWVKAVEARHHSFFESDGQYLSAQPLGFVVRAATGETVYHTGDTSLFSDMRLIAELYRPDIALVGVGGQQRGGHTMSEMDPREAAMAVEWLGVRVAIPMHYIPGSGVDQELAAQVRMRSPQVKVLLLRPGEIFLYP